MRRTCSDDDDKVVLPKDLLRNPETGRKVLLEKLFDLPPSATKSEFVNATLKLPRLPPKALKQTKLESITKKFPVIPAEDLHY